MQLVLHAPCEERTACWLMLHRNQLRHDAAIEMCHSARPVLSHHLRTRKCTHPFLSFNEVDDGLSVHNRVVKLLWWGLRVVERSARVSVWVGGGACWLHTHNN
jgi:hypothetical protein